MYVLYLNPRVEFENFHKKFHSRNSMMVFSFTKWLLAPLLSKVHNISTYICLIFFAFIAFHLQVYATTLPTPPSSHALLQNPEQVAIREKSQLFKPTLGVVILKLIWAGNDT